MKTNLAVAVVVRVGLPTSPVVPAAVPGDDLRPTSDENKSACKPTGSVKQHVGNAFVKNKPHVKPNKPALPFMPNKAVHHKETPPHSTHPSPPSPPGAKSHARAWTSANRWGHPGSTFNNMSSLLELIAVIVALTCGPRNVLMALRRTLDSACAAATGWSTYRAFLTVLQKWLSSTPAIRPMQGISDRTFVPTTPPFP